MRPPSGGSGYGLVATAAKRSEIIAMRPPSGDSGYGLVATAAKRSEIIPCVHRLATVATG